MVAPKVVFVSGRTNVAACVLFSLDFLVDLVMIVRCFVAARFHAAAWFLTLGLLAFFT